MFFIISRGYYNSLQERVIKSQVTNSMLIMCRTNYFCYQY
uniref:Uncharacterized protein n=1 Tax=Rhizophora mucronata TaxID=61149 RepID=A0A2P2QXZ7_RHIMU